MNPPDTRLRIVHVITGLRVGGAERMLSHLVRAGTRCEHAVVVLAELGAIGEQLVANGCEVHALDAANRRNGPAILRKLHALLRRLSPDCLQTWLIHANLAGSVVKPRSVPLVWNVRHSLDGMESENLLTRAAVRLSALPALRAAKVIYNSEVAARQYEAIGYRRGRRVVIGNGFDMIPAAAARAKRGEARLALGVKADDVLVGLVARAHPIKNHRAFLSACGSLIERFPKLRILLAGQGADETSALAGEFGPSLRDRVLWLGERSDALKLTAALDLACNVSLGEGFSNTVGEAMACGVPCMVTDVGESARVVGTTGWVVPSTGSEAIASKLAEVLRLNAAELAQAGLQAQERIRTYFSLDRAVEAYEDLYFSLVNGP